MQYYCIFAIVLFMSAVRKIKLSELSGFSKDTSFLSIVERKAPQGYNKFFKKLIENQIKINNKVFKKSSIQDVNKILQKNISPDLINSIFYKVWIKDIAKVIRAFSDTIGETSVILTLETSRSCSRYHIDNVPMRLLVTYYGKGTEWFPNHACDYSAYYSGEKNDKIIINNNERRFMKPWDIAIFKGQKFNTNYKFNGILHRSPDSALNGKSLLMRLDSSNYQK